jgi:DNA-directed RNA polymerase subunit RPC12/RpoP
MPIDYKLIKVKCRNCGKEYPADSFILDHVYKMMVCPQCVKDRQKREVIHKEAKQQAEEAKQEEEELKKRPAGWDRDDELLERAYAEKQANKLPIVEISPGKFRYRCQKCRYEFIYNKATKTPSRCPYCNTGI